MAMIDELYKKIEEIPDSPAFDQPDRPFSEEDKAFIAKTFRPYELLVQRDDPRVTPNPPDEYDSPEYAASVFRKYDMLSAYSKGNTRFYADEDRKHIERLQVEMHNICIRVRAYAYEDKYMFSMPSPWHAAIFLMIMQLRIGAEHSQVAFRGQYDPGWPIESSWQRVPSDQRHEVKARRDVFESICKRISNKLGFVTGRQSMLAMSQHYSMKTELIDFTTDPSVAIAFALDRGALDYECSHHAVWFREIGSIIEHTTSFVLPPPFLQRMYAQKGFFLHVGESEAKTLSDEMLLLMFKGGPKEWEDFTCVWQNRVIPVYPETVWLETVEKRVECIDFEKDDISIRSAINEIYACALKKAFYTRIGGRDIHTLEWTPDSHVFLLYDAFYRLGFVPNGNGMVAKMDVLKVLVRDNAVLAKQLVNSIRQPPPGKSANMHDRVIPIMDKFKERLNAKYAEAQTGYLIEHKGKRIKSVKSAFNSARRRAGLDKSVCMYTIRHLFTSEILAKGADAKAVANMLGHTSLRMIMNTYYHETNDERRRAIEVKPELL